MSDKTLREAMKRIPGTPEDGGQEREDTVHL